MAFSINEIKAQLKYGGARPTQFNIMITNPINSVADIQMPFKCNAASLPGSSIGVIMVPYFGRNITVPGDRSFQPWQVTVENDEDFAIRNALEEWHGAINALERNIATKGSAPSNYKSQGSVTQFGKDGSELRIYQFNGLWPSEISPIELNWGDRDVIESFQVTWQYDSYEIVGGRTGNGGVK